MAATVASSLSLLIKGAEREMHVVDENGSWATRDGNLAEVDVRWGVRLGFGLDILE